MKRVVLIAGFGGQGILLIGQILAEAAMRDGFHTTWFPSYGPEMRGGTANCTTIYSDDEIGSPIESTYDVVIAMNQPSLERFGPRVRPGGALLVNSSMVPVQLGRDDITEKYIPAREIARKVGNERTANVVMLGALQAVGGAVTSDALGAAISAVVGKKHAALVGINIAALAAGGAAAEDAAAANSERSVMHAVT